MRRKYCYFILIFFVCSCCPRLPDLIKDETTLRQDHSSYMTGALKEKLLLPADDQAKMNDDYNKIYFSVWHNIKPVHSTPEKLSWIFKKFTLSPGYGENKKKHPPSWIKKIQQNASLENYPDRLQKAITTRHTSLRMLPTLGPHFYKNEGDIDGWPFDNLQISSVAANTPIAVFHLSKDKSWALVETSFAFGWMPVEDYALADEDFMKTWESGRYAVTIKDKTSIYDSDGNFSLRTSIGQLFPWVNEKSGQMEILIAVADKNNHAVIKHGFVSPHVIIPKPLNFTYANAVKIANELIDEPYGWGGLYGNRDCSAMTRDFFAPFGIWLPRHSEDQAKKTGIYIDLKDLSPEEKEKTILEQGIPYLSLLWRKGHVMLYVGQQEKRALIFHNVWGLKTIDFAGQEGRKIIGKAVITTLCPGAELYCLDPHEGLLLKTISAMTILTPLQSHQTARATDDVSPVQTENSGNAKTPAYLYN